MKRLLVLVAMFAAVFAAGAADLITAREATNIAESVVAQATNGIRSVDGAARPLPKYLHALDFDDTYPEAAEEYYRSRGDGNDSGGCSAVRSGGFLYRNFDYPFDERAEFVVKMSAGKDRFASVGVAQVGTNLTEQMVTSGKPEYSHLHKWLPGATVDGINENGVAVEVNVVDGDVDYWDNPNGDIHPLGAVRWVLDHATNALHAATELSTRIKFPEGWTQNFHWMIADKDATYIVEDGTNYLVTGRAVMTNFRLYPAPVFGQGWERYQLLTTNLTASITNVWFTRAYADDTEWLSEFADREEMNAAKIAWDNGKGKESHRGQHIGDKSWWQTVHTSIYDITNRVLRVAVQETDDWYVFQVPSAGGVKPDAVREIVQPMIAASTNGLATTNGVAQAIAGKLDRVVRDSQYASNHSEFKQTLDGLEYIKYQTEDGETKVISRASLGNKMVYATEKADWLTAGIHASEDYLGFGISQSASSFRNGRFSILYGNGFIDIGDNEITIPNATGTMALRSTTLSGYGITDAVVNDADYANVRAKALNSAQYHEYGYPFLGRQDLMVKDAMVVGTTNYAQRAQHTEYCDGTIQNEAYGFYGYFPHNRAGFIAIEDPFELAVLAAAASTNQTAKSSAGTEVMKLIDQPVSQKINQSVTANLNTYVDGETGVEYVGKFYEGSLYYVPTGNVYPPNN